MNEYAILLVLLLIFLAWKFYFSIFASEEQKNFDKDKFGEYFVEDIKKITSYLEKLPRENQINIYENVCYRYGRFCKIIWKLEPARGSKFKEIYNKSIKEAAVDRRTNMSEAGYKNPKWLAATIYETLLFSIGNKMSVKNGNKIRKYIFLKMHKLIPSNNNLKIFLKADSVK